MRIAISFHESPLSAIALKGFSEVLSTLNEKKISFPFPTPPCKVVPLYELPQPCSEGGGWGCVLFYFPKYSIWRQCFNNFAADCLLQIFGMRRNLAANMAEQYLGRLINPRWGIKPILVTFCMLQGSRFLFHCTRCSDIASQRRTCVTWPVQNLVQLYSLLAEASDRPVLNYCVSKFILSLGA